MHNPNFPVSLCNSCVHVREIRNARGSIFLLCEKSKADDRLPKYPPQPRFHCFAWENKDQHLASEKD